MEYLNKNHLSKRTKFNNLESHLGETISHELRTQLTIILASAELLDRYSDQWTQTQQSKYLDLIKTAITQMSYKFHPDLVTIEAA